MKNKNLTAADGRNDFLHKLTTDIIRKYGIIAVEDLNLEKMVRSTYAKQLYSIGAGLFFSMLSYKAEWAGRKFGKEYAPYTSQECSRCGFTHADNRKTQSEFKCLACGLEMNADINAAKNILARMLVRIGLSGANVEEVISSVA